MYKQGEISNQMVNQTFQRRKNRMAAISCRQIDTFHTEMVHLIQLSLSLHRFSKALTLEDSVRALDLIMDYRSNLYELPGYLNDLSRHFT